MKLGWLWVPVAGVVGTAMIDGPGAVLIMLAALGVIMVLAMALEDRIKGPRKPK
jgi:hypothetical protein